jgi:Chlorophyllase enzyme
MKQFFVLLCIFCLCFNLNLFSQEPNDTSQFKFALPAPSGEYNIGTRIFFVTDSSRFDSVLNKRGRDLIFQIWYPSLSKQKSTLSYIPGDLIKAMQKDEYNNIDSISLLKWGNLKTHASVNIPNNVSKKFPILFFLHGFGVSRYSYITIIEDLVSHGFVVVSIDSPHSGLMVLPNGEIINTLYDGKPVVKCESMAKDVSFVYDWIKNSKDERLIKLIPVIDFSKAGVVGHSLGGAAALETCRIDNRFSACIDLDGDPFGKVEDVGLSKPTLILLNAPLYSADRFKEPGSKEKWDSMGNERKKMWQDIFIKNENNPAYAIRILGTNHFSFTDFPFVTIQYYRNSNAGIIINKEKGLLIITSYIKAFFDRFIMGDNSINIKKLTDEFPETNIQLTTQK